MRWPSSWRETTARRPARSSFSISPTRTRAGANMRRTGDRMWLGESRPVIISPTKPWKVWKLSPETTVRSSSRSPTVSASALQTLMAT